MDSYSTYIHIFCNIYLLDFLKGKAPQFTVYALVSRQELSCQQKQLRNTSMQISCECEMKTTLQFYVGLAQCFSLKVKIQFIFDLICNAACSTPFPSLLIPMGESLGEEKPKRKMLHATFVFENPIYFLLVKRQREYTIHSISLPLDIHMQIQYYECTYVLSRYDAGLWMQ